MLSRIGYNYGGKKLRCSLGLGSFFMLPEQGMEKFEVLSRGSLFLMKSKSRSKQLHLVSAAHITHPFAFPQLYSPNQYPWLQFVYEEATLNYLQIRQMDTGAILQQFPTERRLFKKMDADLVVMHLKDEKGFLNSLSKYDIQIAPLNLKRELLESSQEVEIIGHDFKQNEVGEEVSVPASLKGTIHLHANGKYYAKTPYPAVMGLCGGPVVQENADECVGMVEALVTNAPQVPALKDNVSIIPSSLIQLFIDEVDYELDVFQSLNEFF
eukprot:TRINITY_DN1469_c0_g1_i14.p2 TRINITY_DN1469_c0_g1~~TRINITY_DN1469_c0_g1_i14.p2  ORF type:complete len:268 (+),score=62.38 TRINITY_DN1469_c0_g1_i14:39-842(+)